MCVCVCVCVCVFRVMLNIIPLAVQLFDGDYTMIQTAMVDFEVGSTCYCFGPCGCTVSELVNSLPHIVYTCTVYVYT